MQMFMWITVLTETSCWGDTGDSLETQYVALRGTIAIGNTM